MIRIQCIASLVNHKNSFTFPARTRGSIIYAFWVCTYMQKNFREGLGVFEDVFFTGEARCMEVCLLLCVWESVGVRTPTILPTYLYSNNKASQNDCHCYISFIS